MMSPAAFDSSSRKKMLYRERTISERRMRKPRPEDGR